MKRIKTFFKAFYKGMKIFGASIVNIVNFILLLPAYIIGVGFTSIFAKIIGKHFLKLKIQNRKSYWVDKEKKKINKDDYYNQY